jgi:hypothetical protein
VMNDTHATFLVVMDKPKVKTGQMPRTFYRKLSTFRNVERIQKSVYIVTGVTQTFNLIALGERYGFLCKAFKILEIL